MKEKDLFDVNCSQQSLTELAWDYVQQPSRSISPLGDNRWLIHWFAVGFDQDELGFLISAADVGNKESFD